MVADELLRESEVNIGVKVVEEKDANTEQKIGEVNSGIYLVDRNYLKQKIDNLDNNNISGEFYLTDIMQQEQCDFLILKKERLPFWELIQWSN